MVPTASLASALSHALRAWPWGGVGQRDANKGEGAEICSPTRVRNHVLSWAWGGARKTPSPEPSRVGRCREDEIREGFSSHPERLPPSTKGAPRPRGPRGQRRLWAVPAGRGPGSGLGGGRRPRGEAAPRPRAGCPAPQPHVAQSPDPPVSSWALRRSMWFCRRLQGSSPKTQVPAGVCQPSAVRKWPETRWSTTNRAAIHTTLLRPRANVIFKKASVLSLESGWPDLDSKTRTPGGTRALAGR